MKGLHGWVSGLVAAALCLGAAGLVAAGEGGGRIRAGAQGQNAAEKHAAAKARAEEAKAKREEAKEKIKEKKEALQHGAEQRIDARQDNQAKRIQHGINKGYLTADEVTKLQNQQQTIANLETSALSDGKLTKAEFVDIRTALNEASRCIWAEKHDTEGNQMPAYRFGKNVFAKDDLTAKLANENINPDEARALMKDFRRMTELKRRLATEDLSDADRAALQTEYDNLLNQYFVVR